MTEGQEARGTLAVALMDANFFAESKRLDAERMAAFEAYIRAPNEETLNELRAVQERRDALWTPAFEVMSEAAQKP